MSDRDLSVTEASAIDPAVLAWLLEPNEPAVRSLTLRDLLDALPDDAAYRSACAERLEHGPVAEVLEAMDPAGYWISAKYPYTPKYKSTYWAMILLAQLGMRATDDPRLAMACEHLLASTISLHGQISTNGQPSNTIDCLQGNIVRVLLQMGIDDPRLDRAVNWMARSVTGDGIAPLGTRGEPMSYQGYHCGPGFACRANFGAPCAWGATKVLLAFAALPQARRTPQVTAAIAQGAEFLLGVEPTTAGWPTGDGAPPSGRWWKFGFPVYYTSDLLQVYEALVPLGYASDTRLTETLALVKRKRDASGRWPLEFSYGSKSWGRFGRVGSPSKWVTLRALRVLRAAGAAV